MSITLEQIISFAIDVLTLGYYKIVEVKSHHEMIDEYCERSIYATYSEFKKEFSKVNWIILNSFLNSLIAYDNSEFHAGIIQFNGTGYKLTTYGYLRANILRRKYIKDYNKKLKS